MGSMCISAIFLCGMMFCYGDSVNNDRVNVVKQDSIWKDVYLEKVVVEGSQVIHYPDKDVWTITKAMRKNTFDTYSLLSKIPGFY